MVDRYEVLAALIDEKADALGEGSGDHHVVVAVLQALHDYDRGRVPADELADEIYGRIAAGYVDPWEPDLEIE